MTASSRTTSSTSSSMFSDADATSAALGLLGSHGLAGYDSGASGTHHGASGFGSPFPTTPTKPSRPSVASSDAFLHHASASSNNHQSGQYAMAAGASLLATALSGSPQSSPTLAHRAQSKLAGAFPVNAPTAPAAAPAPTVPPALAGERRLITQLLKQFKQTAEVRQYLKYYGR